MTKVYSAEKNMVVASGNSYTKVGLHYEVHNCLYEPGQTLELNGRYSLREEKKPYLSVKCIGLPQPGIQIATFVEV